MILSDEVTFVVDHSNEPHDPRNPNWDETETKEIRYVNVTSMTKQKAYRDYGVDNANMQVIRSFTPLPYFDYVLIDGVKYVEYATHVIDTRYSITVKEVV